MPLARTNHGIPVRSPAPRFDYGIPSYPTVVAAFSLNTSEFRVAEPEVDHGNFLLVETGVTGIIYR